LERALSKEPEQRFPTMEDFAAAVSGERAGSATVVTGPVKPAKRLPSRRSVLTVIAVCAIGLAVASWFGYRRLAADQVASPMVQADSVVPAQATPMAVDLKQPVESLIKPRPAKREYAMLTVASEPWGTLYIDDLEIGPTPVADYRLSPGTHRLRIEQEGYQTKIETVVVTGANPIRRRYSLEPQ
jgi:hypothetical protein